MSDETARRLRNIADGDPATLGLARARVLREAAALIEQQAARIESLQSRYDASQAALAECLTEFRKHREQQAARIAELERHVEGAKLICAVYFGMLESTGMHEDVIRARLDLALDDFRAAVGEG